MASHVETPFLSSRNGFRCMPGDGVMVEDVLVAVGEQVGYENISSASRMNKAVVVFLKQQQLVNRVIESGLIIKDELVQVTPLQNTSSKVVISNVPPFISDAVLERELTRFGKFASPIKAISLRCKHPALKHVTSFRRQVYMFLESPDHTLNVSFRVKHEGGSYMVYATTGSLRCFECGDVGHKRFICPHKERRNENSGPVLVATAPTHTGPDEIAGPSEVRRSDNNAVLHEIANTPEVLTVAAISDVDNTAGYGNEVSEIEQDNVCDVKLSQSGCNSVEKGEALVLEEVDDVLSDETVSLQDTESCSQFEFEENSQDPSQMGSSMYTLEEVNKFLDDTFGKQVDVKKHFPDVDKFVNSVLYLQRTVGVDRLSEKRRFRLRKHLTTVRKFRKVEKKRMLKARS